MLRIRDFARSGDTWYASASYRPEGPYDLVPRYRRDPAGERAGYGKLPFSGVERLGEDEIDEVLRPDEATLRGAAAGAASLLRGMGVPRERIGVTGSRLLGLETPRSDIDLVVYGREAFDAAREAATKLVEGGEFSPLGDAEWLDVHRKRSPELSQEEFLEHERRKKNRFLACGTILDLLFVRSWDEIDWGLGELLARELGDCATARGTVVDATYAFDSPAIYELEGDVDTVYSFTHTYAGQALEGEEIEARGHLVEGTDALLVGSTREASGEYVRSLTLLSEGKGAGAMGSSTR